MAGLAIFDLDYTLTRRGTWGRFVIMNVKTRPHLWLPLLISAGVTQWRYKRGKLERVEVKKAMMKWCMAGKSKDTLLAMADRFAIKEVENGLRPGGLAALQAHKNAGDAILIASAAVDIIVEAIATRLGIDHWVATEMDWDSNGIVRMGFKSANCYGPEKLRRVKAYLSEHKVLKQNHTVITMYTDSYSDLEILTYADLPVAVHPDGRLENHAREQGWPVLDWNNSAKSAE